MDHQVDLTRYAERIGYSGEFRANFATLTAIQQAQTCSIPFENFSVLLRHPVYIDLPFLEEKLVTQWRGGYCFEQNSLLLGVLNQIGFDAKPFSGRVRIDRSRDMTPPRTHLFVMVTLDGKTWVVDSGVGSLSLTSPIEFVEDLVQQTPAFFEAAVSRLEDDLGGAYNYAATHFGGYNLYIHAATRNVHFAQEVTSGRLKLRRTIPAQSREPILG